MVLPYPSAAPVWSAADLQARVLARDAHTLILDKPAGLLVHPGPSTKEKGGQSVTDFLPDLRFGFERSPELAHRLDRDTSGCLVLGRHPKALARLGRLFAEGAVAKLYWAVVLGAPLAESGTVEAPLLKVVGPAGSGWRIRVDPAGQAAVTDWQVLGRGRGLALIAARPRTGRTHQIRLHLSHLGHPILGDPFYGPDRRPTEPLHLHARAVSVPYVPGAPLTATAPPPPHLAATLAAAEIFPEG